MNSKEIADFLEARGFDIRQEDVDEIHAMLVLLPIEEHDEIAPGVWEAVAQVVNDPAYRGGAKLPEPA